MVGNANSGHCLAPAARLPIEPNSSIAVTVESVSSDGLNLMGNRVVVRVSFYGPRNSVRDSGPASRSNQRDRHG